MGRTEKQPEKLDNNIPSLERTSSHAHVEASQNAEEHLSVQKATMERQKDTKNRPPNPTTGKFARMELFDGKTGEIHVHGHPPDHGQTSDVAALASANNARMPGNDSPSHRRAYQIADAGASAPSDSQPISDATTSTTSITDPVETVPHGKVTGFLNTGKMLHGNLKQEGSSVTDESGNTTTTFKGKLAGAHIWNRDSDVTVTTKETGKNGERKLDSTTVSFATAQEITIPGVQSQKGPGVQSSGYDPIAGTSTVTFKNVSSIEVKPTASGNGFTITCRDDNGNQIGQPVDVDKDGKGHYDM